MVTGQIVLYLCAKFHNFTASASMAYRLPERKKKTQKKNKNATDLIGAYTPSALGP